MADDERGTDGPSLELPSLRFGRRRRKKAPPPEPAPPAPFVDEVAARTPPAPVRAPRAPVPVQPSVAAPPTAVRSLPEPKPKVARRRPDFALPALDGTVAAVATGVLVGVIAVGLTWASLRVCEVVRGTSSCGGPGYLLLLAIVVAMVLLGAVLLRAWGVPEAGSTSFLAVGLLAVLAMLLLVGVLFQWWMVLVVPACSALTFAAAHWVTTTYVEPGDR